MTQATSVDASMSPAPKALVKQAFKYRQHGRTLYSFVATGHELAQATRVPEFDSRTRTGYQRNPVPDKIQKAANYVKSDVGFFPTSVLLSVRGDGRKALKEKPVARDNLYELVELTIPSGTTLYLVDGQHRTKAIKHVEDVYKISMADFGMSVNLVVSETELDEAKLFRTIHEQQKKMPTDLVDELIAQEVERGGADVRELMATNEKKFREYAAVHALRTLNDRHDSPWKGRVRPANARAELERRANEAGADPADFDAGWEVSSRSMSTSIKYATKVLEGLMPEKIGDVLVAYWKAVQRRCPEAFLDPETYPYLRTTTHGVYIMHMLFPTVWNHAQPWSVDSFEAALSRAGVDDALWRKGGDLENIAGVAGYSTIASELKNRLTA